MAAPIRITVRGDFRVTSREQGDVAPKARKARGVLALLALAPEHRRERTWITEHLWSDRGPAQAAGSLRHALSGIRGTWGPEARALLGEGQLWVALDPALVEVDRAGAGLLLEGLGIHDRRFQAWLARERAAEAPAPPVPPQTRPHAAPHAAPHDGPHDGPRDGLRAGSAPGGDPLRIAVRCAPPRDASSAALLGDIVAHQIAEGIAEQVSTRRLVAAPDGRAVDLDVRCDVIETDGESLAQVCVTHPATGEVLYARLHRADGPARMLIADGGMHRTAHEAAETAVGRLPQVLGLDRPVVKAAALGRLALLRMFRYDGPSMQEADHLLAQAQETSPNAVFDAWRGFLQMAMWVDLGRPQGGEMRAAAEAFLQRAAGGAGDNALVHGLVAHTRAMLTGEAGAALPSAKRAAEMSPTSPMALISLASAQLLAGRLESAYALSRRARGYAGRSRYRHFFDNHHCVVCMATGRLGEAEEAAEAAASALPTYAAAHRHLLALYAARGALDKAQAMHERLRLIEPGFHLDRMLGDEDYPVRTLRRVGLLEAVRRIL